MVVLKGYNEAYYRACPRRLGPEKSQVFVQSPLDYQTGSGMRNQAQHGVHAACLVADQVVGGGRDGVHAGLLEHGHGARHMRGRCDQYEAFLAHDGAQLPHLVDGVAAWDSRTMRSAGAPTLAPAAANTSASVFPAPSSPPDRTNFDSGRSRCRRMPSAKRTSECADN